MSSSIGSEDQHELLLSSLEAPKAGPALLDLSGGAFYQYWDVKERRQLIRELIVHEDKLTTERTQALYTLQGFLFASLGIVARGGFPLPLELQLILAIVSLTGIIAAALYLQEFRYGTRAVLDLLDDWKKIERDYAQYSPPKVIGYESREVNLRWGTRWLTRKVIPVTLMVVWSLVLAVVWLSNVWN